MPLPLAAIDVYSTCPPSSAASPGSYIERVVEAARWCERAGFRGMLVYTDNSLADPWSVAQLLVASTALRPLVAVQPVYMHPYSVAKKVATLGFLYGRPVALNMVAGGFKGDLDALGDPTPHEQRYARLLEYTTIIQRLLASDAPVTFAGEFYRVTNLRLAPTLPRELAPEIFVSGSSEAGARAARALDAWSVEYPEPAQADGATATTADGALKRGIRVGIVSREDSGEAWAIARRRFPEDRKGRLTRDLALKVSDSVWQKRLSERAKAETADEGPYWLLPFQHYKTMCPYLVGSYDRVAEELRRYIRTGVTAFILDVPSDAEDCLHTFETFRRAL